MGEPRDPYNASGDVSHPGVAGVPFNSPVTEKASPEVVPGMKVDNPGTGTFNPSQQGNTGRAQPAGLSAASQYGIATPGQIPGSTPVANPQTTPAPNLEGLNEEDEDGEEEDDNS
jgi:hypothetical protein